MKLQEEDEQPFYGRTIGYCNRGPIYGRLAPYIHRGVCNRGELGTWFPRTEQGKKGKKSKPRET